MNVRHLLAVSAALVTLTDVRADTPAMDRSPDKPRPAPIRAQENHDPRVSLRLAPYVAFAPATVRATIRVPRHDDNRLLRVAVVSERFFRSSDIQLEGAEAAVSHQMIWKNLPAGDYVVVAEVYTATRRSAHRAAQELRVMGY
jgi:hypothetical protein